MQYRNSITAQETCDQIGLKQSYLKVYILLIELSFLDSFRSFFNGI